MKIYMTQQELDSVAAFLNDKYEERRKAAKALGKRYPIDKFAKAFGTTQPNMSRLMKLGPDMLPMEGIDTPLLMAFYDEWGDEFMQAMRGDAVATAAKQAAKKKAKGEGG